MRYDLIHDRAVPEIPNRDVMTMLQYQKIYPQSGFEKISGWLMNNFGLNSAKPLRHNKTSAG